MTEELDTVRGHYQAGVDDEAALLLRISTALAEIERPITSDRVAAFDQFHIGGLRSTVELARRVGLSDGLTVLDAGSGLGGPSRYLAETFGCEVNGVDLAPTYVAISQLLADKAGLAKKVFYTVGSITDLPFADRTFDLVWTQHVVMNIRDRDSLYREIRRVLKKGGRFAFYDPYVPVAGEPPHYPTPWAESSATSTLLTKAETTLSMAQAGLQLTAWDDVSDLGKAWIAEQQQQLQQLAATPADAKKLTARWVVGARMQPMVANFARNIREDRVRLVMGLCDAT